MYGSGVCRQVLLKYPHQTTAVDVWASGVVLASALTARYPFFRAGDDVAALAELADLVGTEPLQRAAEALGMYTLYTLALRWWTWRLTIDGTCCAMNRKFIYIMLTSQVYSLSFRLHSLCSNIPYLIYPQYATLDLGVI